MLEFIMLVGIPASGKSTYANRLKENGYHIHSSDDVRVELSSDVNSQNINEKVFATLHKRIKNDLENGISCVYDATNMRMKRRISFLNEIKKYHCKKKCMLFVTPVGICKERNRKRERKVPCHVFDKMLKQFQCPYYYEGWDEIEIIEFENSHPEYMLEPCKRDGNGNIIEFNQENSHHILSLEEHMKQTHRYLYDSLSWNDKMYEERYSCLLDAATSHDIGKYFTKTFIDARGNKTSEAHYYGHENWGAYVILTLMNNDRDNCALFKNNHALRTAVLVNWHMRPHTAWKQSEKSKERDKVLIGEEMYNDIIMLHEADLEAH